MRTPKSPLHALMLERGMKHLADELGVSPSTLYRWLAENRVPIRHLTAFANAVEISIAQAMDFAAPSENRIETTPTVQKPEGTLDLLIDVKNGTLTLEDAAQALDLPINVLQKTLERNEDRLELLRATLTAYSKGELTRPEATQALKISKAQLHYLLRVYSIDPPTANRPRKTPGRYTQNKITYEKLALDVIAGRVNAKKASEKYGMALRTIHRYIKQLIEPRNLSEISHWPASFRLAWAYDLEKGRKSYIEHLVELAVSSGLVLQKRVRAPKPVENWRAVKASRLLQAVLYGEATLEEVAILRGGSEVALRNLFDGVLSGLGTRYNELMNMGVHHQIAVADMLQMLQSHYRRNIERAA